MKDWATTIAILPLLLATFALAEDFKTVSGRVYKDVTISRVEADGIVLRTKTGISKAYFVELPKDVQERFHYDSAKAVAAQRQRQREQVALQAEQDAGRQVDERRLSSTAAVDDDATPKQIFKFVIVLIAGIIIVGAVLIKKTLGS